MPSLLYVNRHVPCRLLKRTKSLVGLVCFTANAAPSFSYLATEQTLAAYRCSASSMGVQSVIPWEICRSNGLEDAGQQPAAEFCPSPCSKAEGNDLP